MCEKTYHLITGKFPICTVRPNTIKSFYLYLYHNTATYYFIQGSIKRYAVWSPSNVEIGLLVHNNFVFYSQSFELHKFHLVLQR